MTNEILSAINESVCTEVFGIWFLIGAAFVFFMQAGFAMVETGFTRAKNAGNIIMKNLMDFCIGTCVFIVLGCGLLLGEDALGGFLGLPTMGIFTDYANFDWSNFVFNLVFCATAATIVSGSMTEKTKFLAYCIYSGVISAVIYPKVAIIARLSRYERLKNALNELGVTGMTVTQVMGCGIQKGAGEKYRGVEVDATVLPKVKVEVIVGNIPVSKVIETAKKTLYTGHVGDGKIFVYNVHQVVKVRTGEENLDALKDVE